MPPSSPPPMYPSSQYDEHACLKPPVLLWAAVFYLSRALTLPIAMALGSFAGVNSDAIKLFRGAWSADTLIPSVMAAVVLCTLARRVPNSSVAVRWIWAHGRHLLAAAAVLDVGLISVPLLRQGEISDQALLAMFPAVIDIYFLAYILVSPQVRRTFAEFPTRALTIEPDSSAGR